MSRGAKFVPLVKTVVNQRFYYVLDWLEVSHKSSKLIKYNASAPFNSEQALCFECRRDKKKLLMTETFRVSIFPPRLRKSNSMALILDFLRHFSKLCENISFCSIRSFQRSLITSLGHSRQPAERYCSLKHLAAIIATCCNGQALHLPDCFICGKRGIDCKSVKWEDSLWILRGQLFT